MPISTVRLERMLLLLFVASGFAGLVYQAIWSHYLGLILGHAAYAQSLVLAVFMGGLALGNRLFGALVGDLRLGQQLEAVEHRNRETCAHRPVEHGRGEVLASEILVRPHEADARHQGDFGEQIQAVDL